MPHRNLQGENIPNGTVPAVSEGSCSRCPQGSYALFGDAVCSNCTNNTYSNLEGSTECLPCGEQNKADVGENSISGLNTTCSIVNCGVVYNATHTFDLSPLLVNSSAVVPDPEGGDNTTNTTTPTKNAALYGPIQVPNFVGAVFYMGVCSSQGSVDVCKTASNVSINTKFCEVLNDGEGFDVGNKTNITFYENSETGDHGINITYYDGAYHYYPFSGYRTSEVLFACTPGAGVGKPVKSKTVEFLTEPHAYHFRWETEYACRLCNADDYQPFASDCVKKRKTTYYVLNPQAKCNRGVPHPVDVIVACTMPAVTMGALPLVLIILGSVVIIIIIVVVLVILIRKNHKLTYQLLQKDVFRQGNNTAGAEGMVSFATR